MWRARRSWSLVALLALVVLPAAAAGAGSPAYETLSARSRLIAEDRDHPDSHLLPLVVTRPFQGGARVCARYENDVFASPNRGRAGVEVGLWRRDALIRTIAFGSRRVRGTEIDFGCLDAPRLRAGDTLLFDFRFTNMPRLEPRPFGRGGFVNTSAIVAATVEPPPPAEPSRVALAGVMPAFGSVIPPGGKIRVRIAYTCGQPLGCNLAAGFDVNGNTRETVRWVPRGTRTRTLILRCPADFRFDLEVRGLTLAIERSFGLTLDADFVDDGFICRGTGF